MGTGDVPDVVLFFLGVLVTVVIFGIPVMIELVRFRKVKREIAETKHLLDSQMAEVAAQAAGLAYNRGDHEAGASLAAIAMEYREIVEKREP